MYNILSLDGGGSWAIIEVMTLQKLYGRDAPGSRVLKNFDLVVANSGGSIVAAALFLNMSLDRIYNLFNSEGERAKIFVPLPIQPLTQFTGLGPRYNASRKLQGLRGVFGEDQAITLDSAAAQAQAERFVGELYRHVPVQDTGARAATNTFVQRGIVYEVFDGRPDTARAFVRGLQEIWVDTARTRLLADSVYRYGGLDVRGPLALEPSAHQVAVTLSAPSLELAQARALGRDVE